MADRSLYGFLKWTAIALGAAFIGWGVYDGLLASRSPGDTAYLDANTLFKDGYYERALAKYEEALAEAPDHFSALTGKARSLLQLGRFQQALAVYDHIIAQRPDFAPAYANRGILYDRMGRYEEAIADYERALKLDPKLADGPNWLTRFLRLQPQKPPTIDDRARYLRAELQKPPDERVLKVPQLDAEQRSYEQ
jgi:tetratricopeptide (TPR) repeat protein